MAIWHGLSKDALVGVAMRFHTISSPLLQTFPPNKTLISSKLFFNIANMVSVADRIRELQYNNKQLRNKNTCLKMDIHNLHVTIDMLKNKAASAHAMVKAVTLAKYLERVNQNLEDENKNLREQLANLVEKQKIDDELAILRKFVQETDNEIKRREDEMKTVQKVEEAIEKLMVGCEE
jgi:DNA repair exonuclease SbcCD ATPase subunit